MKGILGPFFDFILAKLMSSSTAAIVEEAHSSGHTGVTQEQVLNILLLSSGILAAVLLISLIIFIVHSCRRRRGHAPYSHWYVIMPHLLVTALFGGLTLLADYYLPEAEEVRAGCATAAVFVVFLLALRGFIRRKTVMNALITTGMLTLAIATYLFSGLLPDFPDFKQNTMFFGCALLMLALLAGQGFYDFWHGSSKGRTGQAETAAGAAGQADAGAAGPELSQEAGPLQEGQWDGGSEDEMMLAQLWEISSGQDGQAQAADEAGASGQGGPNQAADEYFASGQGGQARALGPARTGGKEKQRRKGGLLIAVVLVFLAILGTGAGLLYYTANAVNIEDCRVKIIPQENIYTGSEVRPRVCLTNGLLPLKRDKDYAIRYEDNVEPGKATLIVAGTGNYTGFMRLHFQIAVDPAKDLELDYEGDKKFDNSEWINLQWEPSSACSYYVISAGKDYAGAPKRNYRTKGTSFRFKDLNGPGVYRIQVTAIGGEEKTASAVTSQTITLNPLTRTKVESSSPGAGRIRLSWNKVDRAEKYIVTETRESKGKEKRYTVPADETQLDLYGRNYGTNYVYRVRAVTTIDGHEIKGPKSKKLTATPVLPKIGQAGFNERGGLLRGKTGDQNHGREIQITNWTYGNHTYTTWRYVARFKDPEKAAKAAKAMTDACNNDHIGYDQRPDRGRGELQDLAREANWDLSAIDEDCEVSCSPLVVTCINAAGIDFPVPGSTNDKYMLHRLMDTGEFEILTDSKYLTRCTYLRQGDILVVPDMHTGMVL